MKRNSILVLLAAIGVIVMVSSCGKLPKSEIEIATAAIDSARTNGADRYLTKEYHALEDSMKVALAEIEIQKGKMFSNYQKASEKLKNVTEAAHELNGQIAIKKAEMAEVVRKEIAEVQTLLAENNQLIAVAPKGKEGALAIISIQDEMKGVEVAIQEASGMFNANEDHMLVMDKTKAAKEKAAAINAELKEVTEKYKKNSKPGKA